MRCYDALPVNSMVQRRSKNVTRKYMLWNNRSLIWLWAARTTDAWWLDPKFSIAKKQFPKPKLKILAFCWKNALVMQNHGPGIQSEKFWADCTSKNTPKYLTNYSADLPNWPKFLGYLKKLSLTFRSLWWAALPARDLWNYCSWPLRL